MTQTIKVLFASGSENLIPVAIEQMQKLFPELPLVVVSEFPVAGARHRELRNYHQRELGEELLHLLDSNGNQIFRAGSKEHLDCLGHDYPKSRRGIWSRTCCFFDRP